VASLLALALAAAGLSPLLHNGAVGPAWREVNLPQQATAATRYSFDNVDGRDALRVQTAASYGNLVHELAAVPAPHTLRWSVDLRVKAGDDAAVKVCMSFDMPTDRVPFVERQLLRLARARSGLALPAATLCWVWAGAEPQGALLPNAYTRRVRYIVLRQAQDRLATWYDETRDVAADFRRAFGDESADLPPVVAVMVAGDGDNTGASSLAHVSDLRFGP
jgi:hypothetical protein